MAALRYLTPVQVHERTGIAVQTLNRWRCEGQGPRFTKAGRKVLYREDWIDAYLEERAVTTR